jgi:transcriptional regulator with XRE-family HTH domain
MRNDYGSILESARTRAGLSRSGLAAKAGVPTSTVSRIETGANDPTVSTLERLLDAADCALTISLAPIERPPTLAALSTAVDEPAGRQRFDWTRLRGFADWASRHPRELPAAIADPPARTGTPLDPILAAFAEELATRHDIDRPRWTRTIGAAKDEWSAPATPLMQERARAATPEPFARRNLVLDGSTLFRDRR